MNFLEHFGKALIELRHTRIISIITVIFAFVYHLVFLFVFKALGVMPMFYFNFISITVFLCLLLVESRLKSFLVPYIIAFAEVVAHQILADYYLGGNSSFHFFILLMGVIPVVTFERHFLLQIIFQMLGYTGFIVFECIETRILPKYEIADHVITVIKAVNISLTMFVICCILFIFAFFLQAIQKSLQIKILEKTIEADKEGKRRLALQNHIINSLASLVENRDADTGDHIQRTSAYVEILARKAMEHGIYTDVITEEFIEVVRRAAPMHDIGKIVVSDTVLKKPGKLTPEEFEQMKLHAIEGGRIINEVIGVSEDKEYVAIASDVATYHHERWDGKGYPYGLQGTEIPISARLMAIADVFDALVSPRCYKEPMSQDKAFRIIQEESGSHFDPVLAQLFLDTRDETERVLHIYTK